MDSQVQEQLDSLRKALRTTRITVVALMGMMLAAFLLAARTPQPSRSKVVIAEEFRLVDKKGRRLAALQTRPDLSGSHGLFLYDKKGADRLRLRLFKGYEPELEFVAPAHTRMLLKCGFEDWGMFVMDSEGKGRIQFGYRSGVGMYSTGLSEEK